MVDNIQNLLDPQDLAEAKQEGLRKKIEDQRVDINELPALPEGAIDAIRLAGMELKIKVTELLKELETLNNKDPRYVDVKKEIANKVQVMQAWKSSFGSFQQAKQEFFQNLFSYSKANNQLHIARLSDYFGDNHMGWQINGTDVGLLTEEEVFVSTNEIVSLANRLMLPANKERNQLMEQAFVIEDTVAKQGEQAISLRQIDHKLYLQRTDTADGEGGVDPEIPKEYALSTMYDDPEWGKWAEQNKVDSPMIENIVRAGSGKEFRDIVAPLLVQYDMQVKIQPSIDAGIKRYEAISTPSQPDMPAQPQMPNAQPGEAQLTDQKLPPIKGKNSWGNLVNK